MFPSPPPNFPRLLLWPSVAVKGAFAAEDQSCVTLTAAHTTGLIGHQETEGEAPLIPALYSKGSGVWRPGALPSLRITFKAGTRFAGFHPDSLIFQVPLNAEHLRLTTFPMYRRVTAGSSQIQFVTAELMRETPNVTVSPGRDKHQLIRNSSLARANKPAKVFPSPGPEWNVNVPPPPLILILISTQGALPGGPAKDLFDAFEIFAGSVWLPCSAPAWWHSEF